MENRVKPDTSKFVEELAAELSSQDLVFPTSLSATMNIRRALSDPDIDNEHIARIISTEPVLSARVLRICNSVMFARPVGQIFQLRAATSRLGFVGVRNVAISVGMKQLAEHVSMGKASQRMDALWTRSLRIAALSYVLAKKLTSLSADGAMLAGLLHDVGKFYILNRARRYDEQFVEDQALWEIVEQWHARFGMVILKKWDVSADIQQAIRDAGRTDLPDSDQPSLSDVISAANFLDTHFIAKSMRLVDWESAPPALKHLNLDLEKSETLMNESTEELDLILQAIG
jgi:HD-like signal output (HDOD) protein